MAARTIETTDLMEEAFKYLARKKKVAVDDLVYSTLNDTFNKMVVEANEGRYKDATEILASKDPAKIIPALKELLV